MTSLADSLGMAKATGPSRTAEPLELPSLRGRVAGRLKLALDFETTGTRWHGGGDRARRDLPIGAGVHVPGGPSFYAAWGHRGGGNNVDGDAFYRWTKAELAGADLTNHTAGFDCHMAREAGWDWERSGMALHDPALWAALIDDHRRKFALAELCREYLPEGERKVTEVHGVAIDPARMADYHASVVGVRAVADARQAWLLREAMEPILERDELVEVAALEDRCIYAVCEMERNAAPLDVEKLRRWVAESEEALGEAQREIAAAIGRSWQQDLFGGTGSDFLNPDSGPEMERLFKKLGLPIALTEGGRPSFTAEVLGTIDHPMIRMIEAQNRITDLRSKFLLPYLEAVGADGRLRYRLHQLRGDENGTVRGRFSASDKNVQQVLRTKKQRKKYGDRWIIRELFIGADGMPVIAADAMQIEYRIFADYEGSEEILAAYAADPRLNFHQRTFETLVKYAPNVDYDKTKTLNFLTLYGGGTAKLALQLGHITAAQFHELDRKYGKKGIPHTDPLLARTRAVKKAYNRALPGVKPLSDEATSLAKNRGYVKDIIGRRAYFPNGWGAHAALNAVIQPSAATILKQKMIEVHEAREAIGFVPRMPVHDEIVGDALDGERTRTALAKLLDRQSFPKLRVPILWDVGMGRNWAEAKG